MATPSVAIDGRSASIARRRTLSTGKAALPPAAERVRSGPRAAAAPSAAVASPAATPALEPSAASAPAANAAPSGTSCRAAARARRAAMCRVGRGDAPAASPVRPPRIGTLVYAPKVVASETQAGQHVTGNRIGNGGRVTGDQRGLAQPISGTQYIGADTGAAYRSAARKVGLSRSAGGSIVSGTQVRNGVPVTGDEAGARIRITGKADARIDDDVTPRNGSGASTAAQFGRQADPHGASVHTNLARSARVFGSRERSRAGVLEATDGGLPVTGSAIGRSSRVTGDEPGACRAITGDQYLAPARFQSECGGSGGGTGGVRTPTAHAAPTWGGNRITGIDVEQHPRVTGDAPGACAAITGSAYSGPRTAYGWCDDAQIADNEARRLPCVPEVAVTGDTPVNAAAVTGTARGAARAITGTPYYREAAAPERPADPVAALDDRFSVRSPQRTAHVQSARAPHGPAAAERITGSFATGGGKVTGNLEFTFRPRPAKNGESARTRITGEGRTAGHVISGDPWKPNAHVTGTDGHAAGIRNPSERAGTPRAFAGAARFKTLASDEEPKHLVTGMFGYSSDNAAKVTLSGGAQG